MKRYLLYKKYECANFGFAGDNSRECLSAGFLSLVDGPAVYLSTCVSFFNAFLRVPRFVSSCPSCKKPMIRTSVTFHLDTFVCSIYIPFLTTYRAPI